MSKRGKRLTRDQKIMVKSQGLDPKKYLLLNDLGERLLLKEKNADVRYLLDKPQKGVKKRV